MLVWPKYLFVIGKNYFYFLVFTKTNLTTKAFIALFMKIQKIGNNYYFDAKIRQFIKGGVRYGSF
ncbi:hypothetical protein ABM34_05225 [Companilactobacillus ginsenosidimutans]|uniref:Uncharacterized protein n=1 Tax=Companilactobacillus ginsenosidimutans TaxID=1007676 RepID=A0A0H4QGD8_9LACO|nr:hypothetical protein ABM34_05225 [Companilactobacillus ginsenosidimutans]